MLYRLPRQRVLKVTKDIDYLYSDDLATLIHGWSLLQVLVKQIDHTTKFQLVCKLLNEYLLPLYLNSEST